MYIHLDDLSDVLHKYFLYRCRNCVLFSLKVGVGVCVWVWVWVGVGGGGDGWVVSECLCLRACVHAWVLLCVYQST